MPRAIATREVGRVFATAALVVCSLLSGAGAAAADSPFCADLDRLLEASRTQFQLLRDPSAGREAGVEETAFRLANAPRCVFLEDAEKVTYQCTWRYALGDRAAHRQLEHLLDETRRCMRGIAEEQVDRPVNHPDSYLSHYYRLPRAELGVALKHKSALGSTLVTFGVAGFAAPR